MLVIDYRELGWWYWLVIACLLGAGLTGAAAGIALAIGVAAWQCLHFAWRARGFAAFPVQVRLWYLALLLVAGAPPLQALGWLPLLGTWVRLLTGYCLMARCVSVLPWHRREPLSWALLRRTFLSRPVRGSVLHGLADPAPRP